MFYNISAIGPVNSSTTDDVITISYTVTGGFAPTYRSIFYNSTGNEISEVIGYPMRVNVTKQVTDSGEESLKKSILKNEFFQSRFKDYSTCCDIRYYNLTVAWNNMRNSVNWTSVNSAPDNILEIVDRINHIISSW